MAINAFDETTVHRLRIPGSLLESRAESHETSPKDFKLFFSIHEFSRIKSIRVIDLPFGDGSHAYILSIFTTEEGAGRPLPAEWKSLRSFVGERVSIYQSRYGQMLNLDPGALSCGEGARERVSSCVKACSKMGYHTVVVVLPLAGIIQEAQEKYPDLDRYRFFFGMASVFSRMVAKPGSASILPKARICLVFSTRDAPDASLLLTQAQRSFSRLYASLGERAFEPEAIVYPDSDAIAYQNFLNGLARSR
jgi:hypothetical protein